MDLSLSGNALRTFHRSVTCLARVGTELVLQASASRLALHTLNASRSAYSSITFKPDFFDSFALLPSPLSSSSSSAQIQCSVLIKAVCSVLRTPVPAIDRLSLLLPSPDAPKLQFTLNCFNGVKKTYRISCNSEPEVQCLSLDRTRFPSSLVVRPRDLSRLLSNFQSSLQEITIIATEPSAVPPDAAADIGGKAVELRSYIDPTRDSRDEALHTQLWIDPAEEFAQYTHAGDPVDVTFGVKELKAFLSFCEGCEVDIHLLFEKAGEPILMVPRFGFDDGSNSDFDATLVLATVLASQLTEVTTTGHQTDHPVPSERNAHGTSSQSQHVRVATVSDHHSNHTKIWSDISGSAAKSFEGTRDRQAQGHPTSSMQNDMQMPDVANQSTMPPRDGVPDIQQPMETDYVVIPQERAEMNGNPFSQHHPSNWVGTEDDEDEEEELYVQPTPHYDE